MTRNYIFLFLCTTIITISLLEGFFGGQGVIANRTFAKEIVVQQERLDRATLELQNLEYRLSHIWDTDSLLDNARTMGYARKGEVVYYFIDDQGQPVEKSYEPNNATPVGNSTGTDFHGIPTFVSVAIGIATAMSLVVSIKVRRRRLRGDKRYPRG